MELPWPLPLMQAPIGPAATPELVAAVSETGALGTLAASWTPTQDLRLQLQQLRSTQSGPFCVNLVLAFEQRERMLVALEEGAPVLSFSWGTDPELIGQAREANVFVLVQVGTLDEAQRATQAGADALIVQGVEAGGHVQSTRPLITLLQEIRAQVQIPLVAAGGIADANGHAEARKAGADAVACGTVFLAAEEANVHPDYLDSLIAANAADTTLTTAFDGGWPGAPHRVIRNETVVVWEGAGKPERGRRPREGEAVASRNGQSVLRYDDAQPTRETQGDVLSMAMYAGTSVQAVKQSEPASQIVESITRGT